MEETAITAWKYYDLFIWVSTIIICLEGVGLMFMLGVLGGAFDKILERYYGKKTR